MNIGLTAYVVMGNDFPDAVTLTKKAAEAYIARRKAEEEKLRERDGLRSPGVHWRVHEFHMGPPVIWFRRAAGGYHEAQFWRFHVLVGRHKAPFVVRWTNKDYGYD